MMLAVDQSYERRIYAAMPPPKKRYRNGTLELQEAVREGHIALSLPELPDREFSTAIVSVEGKPGKTHSNTFEDAGDEATCDVTAVNDERQQKGERDDATRPEYEVAPLRILQAQDEPPNNDGPRNISPLSVTSIPSQDGNTPSGSIDDTSQSDGIVVLDGGSRSYQLPDPDLPRFSDIIGHGAAKLRIEEVLLPIGLPLALANSILVGEQATCIVVLFSFRLRCLLIFLFCVLCITD
jgi:hypothetical protein